MKEHKKDSVEKTLKILSLVGDLLTKDVTCDDYPFIANVYCNDERYLNIKIYHDEPVPEETISTWMLEPDTKVYNYFYGLSNEEELSVFVEIMQEECEIQAGFSLPYKKEKQKVLKRKKA